MQIKIFNQKISRLANHSEMHLEKMLNAGGDVLVVIAVPSALLRTRQGFSSVA